MALIEAVDIKKTYYTGDVKTPVLKGISFSLEQGEFVSIMGPSGSGKSTLLHILGFLDHPTGGSYRFGGRTMDEYSEDELARVRNEKMGFVFQAFNLLPRATVFENVMLPLTYSSRKVMHRGAMVKNAIEAVGLSHRTDYYPSQISGGEQQRVAIARALVNKPQIIFADEPTGNLDSKSGKMIMEILQKLNDEQGHTIVLITHETYTAEHASRIIRLLDGEVESDRRVARRNRAQVAFKK